MNIHQGSAEWLAWRLQGIGSSDVAAIRGESPWMTVLDLWMIKTGQTKERPANFAMMRGKRLEHAARLDYERQTGIKAPAALATSSEHPFMRVSLDGHNVPLKRLVEIKCPGKQDHQTAREGRVPEKYVAQVQYQLLVTGAEHADYFSYDGVSPGIIVPVKPDLNLQAVIQAQVIAFWGLVKTNTPPRPEERDHKRMAKHGCMESIRMLQAIDTTTALVAAAEQSLGAIYGRKSPVGLRRQPRRVQKHFVSWSAMTAKETA